MEAVLPMIPTPRTLIADDHPDVLAALRMLLRSEGWQTEAATSPSEVIEAISARDYPVVMGATVVYAGLVVVANAASDLLLHAVDPRRRL